MFIFTAVFYRIWVGTQRQISEETGSWLSKHIMFSKQTIQFMLYCHMRVPCLGAAAAFYINGAYQQNPVNNSPMKSILTPGESHCFDIK